MPSEEGFEDDVLDGLRAIERQLRRANDQMPGERTLISALVLSGLVGDSEVEPPIDAADTAVRYADALLRRLQQEQEPSP